MDFFTLVLFSNIVVCPSLTIMVICCVVRRDQAHIIYYTNLLVSNIMQSCGMIIGLPHLGGFKVAAVIYTVGVMANVYFKMCIAAERYSLISCPLLDCIRQIKRSLLVSALVWAFCIITVTPAIVFKQFIFPPVFALLPAPLFIFCLAGILKALPAATSVSTEEKRRSVGALVLLLFNYILIIVTIWVIVCVIIWDLECPGFGPYHFYWYFGEILSTLFVLSEFLDLILFVFMKKGCIDKLLACLCCWSTDSSATTVRTTSV